MNNKGFTLIEILAVLVLVSIVTVVVVANISSSMSLGRNEAYRLMKNNIISAGYQYIAECNQGTIQCDFSFEKNNTFKARVLEESGYFENLKSPIDGAYLGDCLSLKVEKENGVAVVDIIDECYLK